MAAWDNCTPPPAGIDRHQRPAAGLHRHTRGALDRLDREENRPMPGLVLIDGGLGQLHAATGRNRSASATCRWPPSPYARSAGPLRSERESPHARAGADRWRPGTIARRHRPESIGISDLPLASIAIREERWTA